MNYIKFIIRSHNNCMLSNYNDIKNNNEYKLFNKTLTDKLNI